MNIKRKLSLQVIAGFMASLLFVTAVNLFNQNLLMQLSLSVRMVLMPLIYWSIAVIPLLIMILTGDKPSDYGFIRKNIFRQIIVGGVIGIVMSLFLTLLPILFGKGEWVDNGHHYQYLWQFIFAFFYFIFAVGLVEEFIFRGFVYCKVNLITGSKMASLLVSSLLFGLFHFFGGNLLQMLMTAVIGVIFCLCREKIKNCTLLSLMIAHGVYDAMITVWTSIL